MRKITCKPESESTTLLISSTFKAKDASSNGFCIFPLPKSPKSPPFFAELQSLSVDANSSKVVSLLSSISMYSKFKYLEKGKQ